MVKFSVLMSVYYKEKAQYLEEALKSIYEDQTLKPNEIILVQDGPLTEELYNIINKYEERYKGVLKTIPLEENVGLGSALNIGLKACRNELVARMDTDDKSLSNRFEQQIKFMKKNTDIDVLGSSIIEITDEGNTMVKEVPETNLNIIKFFQRRNAINHVTAIFKKSKIMEAGGYKPLYFNEDYYLWLRVLANNGKFHNLPQPLVEVKVNKAMIDRRGGLRYALADIKIQKIAYKLGLINLSEAAINLIIRVPVRLLPKAIRGWLYFKILRKNTG